MEIKPIKSEKEYQQTLSRMELLFDSAVGTKESDEADILALLIDDYEQKHYPIEAPDPIEAIKIRMEEMGLKQKDLVQVIGGKSRVSEVLHRKRKLTIEMIRNLVVRLNLSADILVKDYPLSE
ncbi:MAG: transcriptional regulator [Bacteroidales bacterium]|nr:transcriptional regulator [Bacteroidales bacterium]